VLEAGCDVTVKVRATRSYWHVSINGQTVEVARWNGTVHRGEIEAITLAQKILVARKKEN